MATPSRPFGTPDPADQNQNNLNQNNPRPGDNPGQNNPQRGENADPDHNRTGGDVDADRQAGRGQNPNEDHPSDAEREGDRARNPNDPNWDGRDASSNDNDRQSGRNRNDKFRDNRNPADDEDTNDEDDTGDVDAEPEECKTGFTVVFNDGERLQVHARGWSYDSVNHVFFSDPDRTIPGRSPFAMAVGTAVKYVIDNSSQHSGCQAAKN